jgi:hypothetical protein
MFDETRVFIDGFREIDELLSLSDLREHDGDNEASKLLIRMALVLLVSKYQVYIEAIMSKVKFLINNSKLKYRDLPKHLKLMSMRCFLSDNTRSVPKKIHSLHWNSNTIGEMFAEGKEYYDTVYKHTLSVRKVSDGIFLESSFPMGRTGTGELIDLFKQFNEGNAFDGKIDLGTLNSMLQIRHSIIHKGIEPSSLTKAMILSYKKYSETFSDFVDGYLDNYLTSIGITRRS